MPKFSPFHGLRYDTERVDLSSVIAPPYDVIDADGRQKLVESSEHNAVHVELVDTSAPNPYQRAAEVFQSWKSQGILKLDDTPSFYIYKTGFRDVHGRQRQMAGVLGALELRQPGEGILPHELTTAKAKSDRLEVLRTTRANLSPIWGLTMAEGFSVLCETTSPPDARATDEAGIHHRLWRVSEPGLVDAIANAVASAAVIIADGHHRYETGLKYRAERQAQHQSAGDFDSILAFIVELSSEQLDVRAIHRIVRGLPGDLNLIDACSEFLEFSELELPDEEPHVALLDEMTRVGGIGLRFGTKSYVAKPTEQLINEAESMAGDQLICDIDSSYLAALTPHLPGHPETEYEHRARRCFEAGAEPGTLGVLLRPVTVDQIADTARLHRRMIPKSTFFYPKPATGLVFREIYD